MTDVRINVPPRLIEAARAAQYANRAKISNKERLERIKKGIAIQSTQQQKKKFPLIQEREGGQLEFTRVKRQKVWTRRRSETPGWLLVPSENYINDYYLRVISNIGGETTSCASLVSGFYTFFLMDEFAVEYGYNCRFLLGAGPNNSNLLELKNPRFNRPVPTRGGDLIGFQNLIRCSFGTVVSPRPVDPSFPINKLRTPPSTAETIEFILRIGREDAEYAPSPSTKGYYSFVSFYAFYAPNNTTEANLLTTAIAASVLVNIFNEVEEDTNPEISWQPRWQLGCRITDVGSNIQFDSNFTPIDVQEGSFNHFAILQKDNNIKVFFRGQLFLERQLSEPLPRNGWSWQFITNADCLRQTDEEYNSSAFLRLAYPTDAGLCAIHGLRYTGDIFYNTDSFTPPESITSLI